MTDDDKKKFKKATVKVGIFVKDEYTFKWMHQSERSSSWLLLEN